MLGLGDCAWIKAQDFYSHSIVNPRKNLDVIALHRSQRDDCCLSSASTSLHEASIRHL
jgi:hypothetical protein